MEMLCDTCVNGYDLGAPDLSCKECQTAKIERDDSDYVTKCSRYKQKPMLNIKDPDDPMTNGQMLDKSQKEKIGICRLCSKYNTTFPCNMIKKKFNVRGEVYECTHFHQANDAEQNAMIPSGEPPTEYQTKPDLPVIPSTYASANKRIKELANGISCLASYYGDAYKDIRVYAKEILAQCDLIEKCKRDNNEL